MRSLESPAGSSGRGRWVVVLVLALLAAGVAAYLGRRATVPAPTTPAATAAPTDAPPARSEAPTTANVPRSTTERAEPAAPRGRTDTGTRRGVRGPAPAPTAAPARRELRVTSDVAGAYVFVDRKFLGTTPLVAREVSAGSHQLNVQTEGHPPHVQTIEVLAEGPTVIEVTLARPPAAAVAALDASVAVVHQHTAGSCEGTLRATGDGLRYETTHKDAFSLDFAALQTFAVDYAEKRLRVKGRGGKTWNFTTRAATADPLFVFHRDVEAARQ